MVQSYQSPVRVYKYPFELVMAAYERRFPTCEMIPVFLGSDTISETTSSDGAEHIIERRCRLAVEAPYLLKKIICMEHLLFVQKNSLDRRTRVLKIEAYNESFASRVIINETCQYFVHPEEPNWTCFEQQASLDVKSFFGFESTVEKVAMKQYSLNISKGKEIIEHFINELRKDGITEVPRWVEPVGSSSTEKPAITSGSDQKRSSVRRKKSTSEAPSGVGSRKGSDGTVLALEEKGATANVGDEEDEEEFHSGDEEEDEEEDDGTTELARRRSKLERTFSGDEAAMFKLEADYIQRCLGKLAPMQESRLVQLKKWVAELQKGKMPKDATLLRFLRARDFHLERAREMLSQSLVWRKQHQVDKILQEYQLPQVVQDYFPGGWHNNYDKDGRPVYLLRLGQMDVKGLMKSVGEEGLFKLTLHICEEGIRMTEEQTRQLGRPISTWTLLVDLEGLNMRHLWRPGVKTLLKIIEVMEANYPETMGRVLIVRAPRVFPILWTVVGTFIDDNTRCKFVFFSGNDYQQEPGGLSDYIDPEFIPDFLGGSAKTRVNEGGLVPKTQYMTEEEMEKNRDHFPLSEDPIYQSVSIARGQVHEVLINNEDVGSVICWDFDVMKQAVAFSVLRTRVPLPAKIDIPAKIHPDHHDHRSVIEKAWKEGSDYFLVEDVITCHDGESVQGSHTTQHKGTYVLQWRFLDPQAHSFAKNVTELIDSITITHHKAKIMYYHEVLNSQDLKGSMSSLISAHSANSSNQSRSQSCVSGSTPSR